MAMSWLREVGHSIFVDLIKAGKPLTVTDPEMTRFLMSLEDSVDLVLHAFKHAKRAIFLCRRRLLQPSVILLRP